MKKFVSVGIILFVCFIAIYVYINISQINNNIAVSDFNRGNYENALSKFKRAAIFKNEEDIIKYNLANTNTKMYDYEAAKKTYLDLLEDQSVSQELKAEIYFNLGNIECMYENFDEALEYYYIALTINPEDKDIKYNIELVEYLSRPIVYNNEILILPKQKLSEQISLMEKENYFKDKISDSLESDVKDIYDEYIKFTDNEPLTHKYLHETNVKKKLNIQKALLSFNGSYNEYLKNLAVKNDKELQKKLNKIKEKINRNKKNIDNYEQLKLKIIKGTNTKEKLMKILSGIKYNDGLNEIVLLEKYNPLSEENEEKDINIVVRDCLHLLNQAQYYSFLEQNSEVLDDINNIVKLIVSDSSLRDADNIKEKLLQIINFMIYEYVGNIIADTSVFDEYLSMAQNYDNEILRELKNLSLSNFITELKNNNKYDLTYDKIIFYYKQLYKYNINIANIHLLLNSLIERDLYNINCIEYTQNVLEQTNVLTGKDIMEIYKFLNTILSSSMECSAQIKEQKQIYETIERDNNTAIDTIIKILSLKFYFNSINLKNKSFEEVKNSFIKFLDSFDKKEKTAQQTKHNMKELAKEVKELTAEISAVDNNKHMYADIKEAVRTLQEKKNITEDKLKETEIGLIKDIKSFIENFIPKLSQEITTFKNDIKNTEILLKNVVYIDEFEQKFAKDRFFIENKDLEVELNNFEQNKKYLLNSGLKKSAPNDYNTDSLVSKSIYQKQKLEDLLIEEKKVSEQIEELKSSSDSLLKKEKQELDMLERDLVDKQLSLVKYYITVENDNTKKSMTRQLMQSLYKEKYEAEKKDDIADLDLDNFEYSNFRNSILTLYKVYAFQLRELNKLMFRIKVINSILELEATAKLNKRIEFDKEYLGGKNVRVLTNELESFKQQKIQRNQQEMKEIITIFKENMSSAKELKERLVAYGKKQQKIKEDNNKMQQQNISRKIDILNNKISFLEEHMNDDEQLNSQEDIEKMKEEIANAKKEKTRLIKFSEKMNKNAKQHDDKLDVEKIMESIVQSSDIILDNIDKNGKRDDDSLSRNDVNRILYQQSNKDKSLQKKNNNEQTQIVQNDW